MKYFAPILLILSFVGIAIFGFAIFNHVMHSTNSGCVASTIDWATCPTTLTAMTFHHISALQAFLQILLPSTASILLPILLFSVITCFFLRKIIFSPQLTFLFRRYRISETRLHQQKITSWLALFELSPAL